MELSSIQNIGVGETRIPTSEHLRARSVFLTPPHRDRSWELGFGRTCGLLPKPPMLLALSRATLLRTVALLPALTTLPSPAAEPAEPARVFQSDDKSWDVTLPPSWTLEGSSVRTPVPRLFTFHAGRGKADVSVTVDLGKFGTSLREAYGTPEQAAAALTADRGSVLSAEAVPGRVKGSTYYLVRWERAGGSRCVTKLGVQQNRRYELTASAAGEPGAEAEMEAIVASFNVFPVNAICISQSNKGNVPVSVCTPPLLQLLYRSPKRRRRRRARVGTPFWPTAAALRRRDLATEPRKTAALERRGERASACRTIGQWSSREASAVALSAIGPHAALAGP